MYPAPYIPTTPKPGGAKNEKRERKKELIEKNPTLLNLPPDHPGCRPVSYTHLTLPTIYTV